MASIGEWPSVALYQPELWTRFSNPVVDAAFGPIGKGVIGAEKVAPHADRLGGRGHVECQALLDLLQQIERVAGLAVELVDERHNRHVTQPAHLEGTT